MPSKWFKKKAILYLVGAAMMKITYKTGNQKTVNQRIDNTMEK
jgi:hypothetical protein